MGADASPFAAAADGVRVSVRLTPRASRTAITGIARDAAGTAVVTAMVTAAPEDGKANAALVKLLAREWRVAKSGITVVKGATDRRKLLHVAGDPAQLSDRLAAWEKGLA
ncbi:MAG: DUF167 family protein [Alphaproteobacteria bacterium]